MRSLWWKILCMILMVYAIVAGMLFPLSPATHYIDVSSGETGKALTFNVFGYNTNYSQSKKPIRAWLKKGKDFYLCASDVKVVSDRQLTTTFQIPEKIADNPQSVNLMLIVDSEADGHSVLPGAVTIKQTASNASMASSCQVDYLEEENQGITFPFRNILEETIRSLYYHVPLWFAMMIFLLTSMIYSIMYLVKMNIRYSIIASEFARVGVLFGILGLVTGMMWAKHTWGAYWNWDIRQNTAAIQVLIYLAYFILRDSFDDMEKKARIGAVYNIFAFATVIPLMFVIPRLSSSLHPGTGGNPALGSNDLDNTMRMVFYPAIIGFTLLGVWITSLFTRLQLVKMKYLDTDEFED